MSSIRALEPRIFVGNFLFILALELGVFASNLLHQARREGNVMKANMEI